MPPEVERGQRGWQARLQQRAEPGARRQRQATLTEHLQAQRTATRVPSTTEASVLSPFYRLGEWGQPGSAPHAGPTAQ